MGRYIIVIARGNKRCEEFSWNEDSSFWAAYVVRHAQGVDRVMHKEDLRNPSDWWIIIFWQASHFSSTACQTLYMGSGLPTRKSVLNHSMTSTFSFLCTSRTNCSISSLFAADWGDAVEQNYVAILSWHSLSGERIINQGGQCYQTFNLSLFLSGFVCLTWVSCSLINGYASTLSLLSHLLLMRGQVYALILESGCIGDLGVFWRPWDPVYEWVETFYVWKYFNIYVWNMDIPRDLFVTSKR